MFDLQAAAESAPAKAPLSYAAPAFRFLVGLRRHADAVTP
jgi:hypothetical protein